jgi:hypothetical protein
MPLVYPVRGTADGEKHTGFFFDWYEQWSSLFGGCNWYDFTVVHLGGEFAPYTDRWEFEFALLGVGIRVQYVYTDRFSNEMQEMISDIEAKRPSSQTEKDCG